MCTRDVVSIVLALLFVAGIAADKPTAQPFANSGPQVVAQEVDGRKNPEQIPPHVAWEHFFRQIVDVAFDDGVPNDANIRALGIYNIGISEENARVLVGIAKETLHEVDELRAPLNDEHYGRVKLDWPVAKRQAHVAKIETKLLDGRERLKTIFTAPVCKAIEKYVSDTVVPTIRMVKAPGSV